MSTTGFEIAIIGMVGRFPQAPDVETFWQNLQAGRECLAHMSEAEVLASGVDSALVQHPDYVRTHGVLEDADLFDASFFKMTPREAEMLDPQQRVALECAWAALEHAGYGADTFRGVTGIFAGASHNTYMLHTRQYEQHFLDELQMGLFINNDFLATRIAYKLNLKGPAFTVQTACSTSLVAIHLACQSLLGGECDMALAGGVSVSVPLRAGYLYHEGGIASPDGHCRPFDAAAQGTVSGDGVGFVVLKRLTDAQAANDTIHAIIKGSAINNDGSTKIGYTAPSAAGQAEVIRAALRAASVSAESISYVEAHGTGTALGDPIEMQGLMQAFVVDTDRVQFCGLGSVKGNVGHLDTAAGVAGLIKVVQMMKYRQMPPSLHYTRPNPQIPFATSPFFVCTGLRSWETGHTPRRAGVSSFGIGGTNAHTIIEEAAPPGGAAPAPGPYLLTLSAQTSAALEAAALRLASALRQQPDINLADAAYTLHVGRSAMSLRRALVCQQAADAVQSLERVDTSPQEARTQHVALLFPGQGAQHVNMGRELYQRELVFRSRVDHCAELLIPWLGCDLRDLLYPAPEAVAAAQSQLEATQMAQPALFVVEYALAHLWQTWGLTPHAMLGHSVGELVAACLAGVFQLEDVLRLIAQRGALMQSLPPGAMLSVPLSEAEVVSLLGGDLDLAAVNGPHACAVSGPSDVVEALRAQLQTQNIPCRLLQTSHAFHSSMVEPIVAAFTAEVGRVVLHKPRIPFLSNVTGTWISDSQATSPEYWGRHIRQTVRFQEGLQTLIGLPDLVLLETGPGQMLTTLAREQTTRARALASLPHPRQHDTQQAHLLGTLGQLWQAGLPVDWPAFHKHETRQRIPLPTYPFARQRHWLTSRPFVSAVSEEKRSHDRKDAELMPLRQTHSPRYHTLVTRLKQIIETIAGIPAAHIEEDASFVDLNFDSLLLLQFNQAVQEAFRIKMALRLLFEEASTVALLAAYLDQQMPPEPVATPAPQALNRSTVPSATVETPNGQSQVSGTTPGQPGNLVAQIPGVVPQPMAWPVIAAQPVTQATGVVGQVLEGQLRLMAQQLVLLQGSAGAQMMPLVSTEIPAVVSQISAIPAPPPAQQGTMPDTNHAPSPWRKEEPAFHMQQPVQLGGAQTLTAQQQAYLADFTARFTRRTQGSKNLTQENRTALADPISSTGYRQIYKELTYPLYAVRSHGSHLWDVDGNEYIDIAMGFGVHLFGHSPSFIMEAIQQQLQEGIPIGTQTPLVGEVARLACELTGFERAMFANSGTDAVMVALRMARAASGRHKVVMFAGDYHGTYEGVLARMVMEQGEPRTIPVAPGIPPNMVSDVIVLPYDDPRSLEAIRNQAHELAAVLVEPVQSRQPDLQPRAFLQNLRRLTTECDVALIFDEVITGFRVHQQGAQGWFGMQADLATYSKVVGGGLPFSIVAGRSKYLDTLDGGMWRFGDASFPAGEKTHFGGAFFKHPLSLATAWATLNHLKTAGPALQESLNNQTAALAEHLNAFFARQQVPIRMVFFGSLFSFAFDRDPLFSDLFWYHLNIHGIYTWRGRTCFLSTAHTRDDITRIIQGIEASVRDMQQGGFFPDPGGGGLSVDGAARSADVVETSNVSASQQRIPLTEQQMQAWLATQMEPEASQAYNECFTLHLRGSLQIPALHQALQELVDRHDALRTTFSPDGSYQEIARAMTLPLPLHDFRLLPPEVRAQQVQQWIDQRANQPFDLVHGPLFAADLLQLALDEHLLVLSNHHLIGDAQSQDTQLTELMACYTAACQGQTAILPPAMQFRQYAAWLAEQQNSRTMQEARAYWLAQFADALPAVNLPTDWPRPQIKTYHGTREGLIVNSDVVRALRQISRRQGCTLFVTMLTGLHLLLHHLTGQSDLVVGVPATGQALVRSKDLVGYCLNVLPIRSRVESDTTLAASLARSRTLVLDGYDHQLFTLGQILREVRPRRDPSRLPLVMVSCTIERALPLTSFPHLEVTAGLHAHTFAKFDLGVTIREEGQKITLSWNYNTDLFSAATIRHWLHLYEIVLTHLAEHADLRFAELSAVLADQRREQEQMLTLQPQPPAVTYPAEANFHQLFEAQAAETPTAPAAALGAEILSYQELNARANQLARYLQGLGVRPETPVALCIAPSPPSLVAVLGILKAGGTFVALDPALPAARFSWQLTNASAPLLLITRDLLAGLQVPKTLHVVCLDEDWSRIASLPAENVGLPVDARQLAYILYTSGSTGTPKGVGISHRSLVNYALAMQRELDLQSGLHLATVTPLTADLGHTCVFPGLLTGGCVHLIPAEIATSGQRFAAYTQEHPIDVLKITPSHLSVLLETAQDQPILPRTHLLLGGETFSRALFIQLQQISHTCRIFNHYGLTETTVGGLLNPLMVEMEISPRGVPLGRPIANCEAYVVDAQMYLAEPGALGELSIGGAGLARGYWQQPGLTAERFVPHPWSGESGARLYRTGDLVRLLPNGLIEFQGRNDHQVKIHGQRIELGEVEAALSQAPGVRACAVTTHEDAYGQRELLAYVVLHPEGQQSNGTLRAFLQPRLPQGFVPTAFLAMETLPLLANGKVDRQALPMLATRRLEDAQTFVAPQTSEEQQLARLWQDLLGLERVSLYDDFFMLGGHSLLAIRMRFQIQRLFGVDLPLVRFFEKPTLAALAAEIVRESALSARRATLQPVARTAYRNGEKASSSLSGGS